MTTDDIYEDGMGSASHSVGRPADADNLNIGDSRPRSASPAGRNGTIQNRPAHPHEAISLRDWFAGQALIGIMSTSGAFDRADRRVDMVSNRSYEFADAMIKARTASLLPTQDIASQETTK